MSYLKAIGAAVIYIGTFLALITFMPGLPPYTEFQEYSITPPRALDPKVGPTNRLTGVQKLFEDEINAPEAFDSYNGQLYTGVHGGYVLRIEDDRMVPIVKFGEKCDGRWQEHICGRPLGLKFDKKGNLYVVDAYYGIFKVNVETREYKNIVNVSKPIEGKVPRLPNSVDTAENGDLYWTESSTDFYLYDLVMLFLSNPSGRLIRYNAATKENEVLMRNLGFANGIMLSDDESFVIVAESMTNRIMKYNLKGPKAGQYEIFIDGLPGLPDNINSDGQGGFLVTIITAVDPEHPNLGLSLAPHPYLRKMLVRLLVAMEFPFKVLYDIYPHTYIEKAMHAIGGSSMIINSGDKSLVLRVDASGNIIEVLSSGDMSQMSAAHIHNGFLWFGSPWLNYLARVPLKQAFPDLAISDKQSSHTRSEKQLPNADVKTERAKRDTGSTTAKPTTSQTTSKPTAAPTTSPKPTAAPTKTPKPTAAPTTTPKPTAAPTTTPKPTAAPKPSAAPKTDKPTGSGNVKPSVTKSSTNAEVKKDNAKPNPPNAKSEENSKKVDAAKTSTQSGKNVKPEQDATVKQKAQKSQPEKVKQTETNRPKDDLK